MYESIVGPSNIRNLSDSCQKTFSSKKSVKNRMKAKMESFHLTEEKVKTFRSRADFSNP